MHYDQTEDSHKNHTTKNSEEILADFKPIDPANLPSVSFSLKHNTSSLTVGPAFVLEDPDILNF